jgi:3-oxosteroid 1-dehydrogenase
MESKAIAGLYAADNSSTSVTARTDPGPGVTLWPAMTFRFIAMEHTVKRLRK